MRKDELQAKPVYMKPAIEVLGGLGQMTQFQIDPNKWTSAADYFSGGISGVIADGGPGS